MRNQLLILLRCLSCKPSDFKILFVFWLFLMVCLGVNLFEFTLLVFASAAHLLKLECSYPPWSSLSFPDVWVIVSHQILKIFGHYFFKYSFCPFLFSSGIPIMQMVYRRFLRFCSFFFISFCFCSSDE